MVLSSILQEVDMGSMATGIDYKKSLEDLKNLMDSFAFLILFSGSYIPEYWYTKLVVNSTQILYLSS